MKRAVIALTWLTLMTNPGRAEESTRQAASDRASEAQDALASAASDVKDRASDVAARASERAGAAAHEASEKTREAASALSERARELARGVAESAKDGVALVGERASEVLAGGRAAASDALDKAREEARSVLIHVADKLDRQGKEERQAARRARWEKLKARFSLGYERPTAALSEELRDHEYRVARLKRVRELAREADDDASIEQSDRLLETEYARHKRRIERLREDDVEEASR
jgi:hypothetical protein